MKVVVRDRPDQAEARLPESSHSYPAASGRFFACMVRLREQYLGGSWECKIAGALRRTTGETARDRPVEPA